MEERMKFKILEILKRPFWIAFWVVLLAIFLLGNKYGIDFEIRFKFQSYPMQKETPANPALKTQVIIEDPVIRHRNQLTQSLDVHSI